MVAERISEPLRTSIRLPDTICKMGLDVFHTFEGKEYGPGGRAIITPEEIVVGGSCAILRLPVKQTSWNRFTYEVITSDDWHEVMARPGPHTFPIKGFDAAHEANYKLTPRYMREVDNSPLGCVITGAKLHQMLKPVVRFNVATRNKYDLNQFTLILGEGALLLKTASDAGDFTWCADITRRADGPLFDVAFSGIRNNKLFQLLFMLFGETGAKVTLATAVVESDPTYGIIKFAYGRLALYWSVGSVGGNDARTTA